MMDDDRVYEFGSLVPIKAYQVTIGIIFALAILSYIAGSAIKIKTRRFLFADELLLLLAVVSLILCTAFAFVGANTFYEGYAVLRDPALISTADGYDSLERMGSIWFPSFTFCAWTAIFCGKAYVLRISWHFLGKSSWIRRYLWTAFICTGISWSLLCAAAFILQSYDYFLPDSSFGHSRDVLFLVMSGLTTFLDIMNSLMIAFTLTIRFSKPVVSKVYRQFTFISWSALSAMVLFTILRVCRLHDAINIDVVWIVLWHYLEAGISIVLLSFASLRIVPSVGEQTHEDIRSHGEVHTKEDSTTLGEVSSNSDDNKPQPSYHNEMLTTRAD